MAVRNMDPFVAGLNASPTVLCIRLDSDPARKLWEINRLPAHDRRGSRRNVRLAWGLLLPTTTVDKAKPPARVGRKAAGLSETAGLPTGR